MVEITNAIRSGGLGCIGPAIVVLAFAVFMVMLSISDVAKAIRGRK